MTVEKYKGITNPKEFIVNSMDNAIQQYLKYFAYTIKDYTIEKLASGVGYKAIVKNNLIAKGEVKGDTVVLTYKFL